MIKSWQDLEAYLCDQKLSDKILFVGFTTISRLGPELVNWVFSFLHLSCGIGKRI